MIVITYPGMAVPASVAMHKVVALDSFEEAGTGRKLAADSFVRVAAQLSKQGLIVVLDTNNRDILESLKGCTERIVMVLSPGSCADDEKLKTLRMMPFERYEMREEDHESLLDVLVKLLVGVRGTRNVTKI